MSETVNPVSETGKVPSVLIRDIPDDWHRRLRVAAAYKGESQSTYGFRALMAEIQRTEAEMEAERRERDQ